MPITTIELTTAKYLDEVNAKRALQAKYERNQKAIRDFVTFLFGLVAIGAGMYLGQHVGAVTHVLGW